jgi:hypothetical protein
MEAQEDWIGSTAPDYPTNLNHMKWTSPAVCRILSILILMMFLIPLSLPSFGQPDSLLSLRGDQHMDKLWHWYHHNLQLDSTTFLSQLDKLESTYKNNNQKSLAQQAWFFKVYYRGANLYAGQINQFFPSGYSGGKRA